MKALCDTCTTAHYCCVCATRYCPDDMPLLTNDATRTLQLLEEDEYNELCPACIGRLMRDFIVPGDNEKLLVIHVTDGVVTRVTITSPHMTAAEMRCVLVDDYYWGDNDFDSRIFFLRSLALSRVKELHDVQIRQKEGSE